MNTNQLVLKDEDLTVTTFDPDPTNPAVTINRKYGVHIKHNPTGLSASSKAHKTETENRVSAKYHLTKGVQAWLERSSHWTPLPDAPTTVNHVGIHWDRAEIEKGIRVAEQALRDMNNGVMIGKLTMRHIVELAVQKNEGIGAAESDVIRERAKQRLKYSAANDDGYQPMALTRAAVASATMTDDVAYGEISMSNRGRRQNLVRAAAFLIAEIDRMDRIDAALGIKK